MVTCSPYEEPLSDNPYHTFQSAESGEISPNRQFLSKYTTITFLSKDNETPSKANERNSRETSLSRILSDNRRSFVCSKRGSTP